MKPILADPDRASHRKLPPAALGFYCHAGDLHFCPRDDDLPNLNLTPKTPPRLRWLPG